MITLYLQSSMFSRNIKENTSTCKLSFRDKNKTYHNKILEEELFLPYQSEVSNNYLEISSLLLGLKNINYDNIKKLKDSKKEIKTLRIVSNYQSGAFIRNSIKQLFDNWEYLDFRGVPYKELWREIYSWINKLKEYNIDYIIKEK